MRGSGGIRGWGVGWAPRPAGSSQLRSHLQLKLLRRLRSGRNPARSRPPPACSALGFLGPRRPPEAPGEPGEDRGGGAPESVRTAGRRGDRTAPKGSLGAKDGEGGRAQGRGPVRRRAIGYRRAAEYFGQFREVKECLVMQDPLTRVRVRPSPLSGSRLSPRSAAALCLVTICLSLTTARGVSASSLSWTRRGWIESWRSRASRELDSKTVSGPRGFGGLLGEGGRWRRGAGLCPGARGRGGSWMGSRERRRRLPSRRAATL